MPLFHQLAYINFDLQQPEQLEFHALYRLKAHLRALYSIQHIPSTLTMSSSTYKPGLAPWREQFLSHISKMTSPEFTFSTISYTSDGEPVPRARTCVFRGFWCCVPEDSRNTAERNPNAYESDMPMLSTDVRMEKVSEVIRSAPGANLDQKDVSASDGGGPVEAVWWVKEQGIRTQWRVRGDAWALGLDIEEEHKESSLRVKHALGTRMRCVDDSAREKWSWEKEVGVVFGAQSPAIKGI
jgi:pyridoxamine 5'-phosphate oxidase